MRKAQEEGGFAAVLARGDDTAGALLLILAERGRRARILEKVLQPGGRYLWQDVTGPSLESDEEVAALVSKRRRFDPDLWVVELDIASAERFAAEMNGFD